MQVIVPICDLRLKPNLNSNLETQFLYGERIEIIGKYENWLLCKSKDDNYTGYLERENIGEIQNTNYKISSLSCFIYKSPNIKSRVISKLFLNSKILASKLDNEWFKICFEGKKYFIHNKDLCLKKKYIDLSLVEVAVSFLNTPYLWGGKSQLGLDCSALVQLALQSINKSFPRNSFDQFNSKLLKPISEDEFEKGTLVFWKGHVAIAINKKKIIHSNAYHMKVKIENLCDAKKRIENSYGKIIGFKKLI